MAKRKTQQQTLKPDLDHAAEPMTGLGESIEQIEEKCKTALKSLLPFLRKDAKINEALEAMYQWGLVEKRARKLRRRIVNKLST